MVNGTPTKPKKKLTVQEKEAQQRKGFEGKVGEPRGTPDRVIQDPRENIADPRFDPRTRVGVQVEEGVAAGTRGAITSAETGEFVRPLQAGQPDPRLQTTAPQADLAGEAVVPSVVQPVPADTPQDIASGTQLSGVPLDSFRGRISQDIISLQGNRMIVDEAGMITGATTPQGEFVEGFTQTDLLELGVFGSSVLSSIGRGITSIPSTVPRVTEAASGLKLPTPSVGQATMNSKVAQQTSAAVGDIAKATKWPAIMTGLLTGYLLTVNFSFNERGDAAQLLAIQSTKAKDEGNLARAKEYNDLATEVELSGFLDWLEVFGPLINVPINTGKKIKDSITVTKNNYQDELQKQINIESVD